MWKKTSVAKKSEHGEREQDFRASLLGKGSHTEERGGVCSPERRNQERGFEVWGPKKKSPGRRFVIRFVIDSTQMNVKKEGFFVNLLTSCKKGKKIDKNPKNRPNRKKTTTEG